MYELFEHTADLGLRVASPELPGLFRDAGRGLFSVIVEEAPRQGPERDVRIRLAAERLDYLFVDWLNELLYTFDAKGLLLDSFEVDVRGTELSATARSRPFDDTRDRLLHEVKAITYHALRVEQTNRGWEAEVILDI